MTETPTIADAWPKEANTPSVQFFHTRVRALVAERLAAAGTAWEQAVHDPALELTRSDLEAVEAALLATGYRFEASAEISAKEAPEKYQAEAAPADSGAQAHDEAGRPIVGTGDNVVRHRHDVTGTARFVSTVDTVMDMLVNGVPEGTIAVIDDSGGTLTAPVLESFAGVVCMGGTVRSHLGILTREYGIPCLMAADLDGLADGDHVLVEYSTAAVDAYAEADSNVRARIVKLP